MSELGSNTAQNNKITSLLLSEAETGGGNKAPKLTSLDDYPHWKDRFEIHVLGIDSHLWQMFEDGYTRPRNDKRDVIGISDMTTEQRRDYDFANRAYALLSQSIPRDIFHQFRTHRTAKALWDALSQRYEGSANLKKLKGKNLRKEFDNFSQIGNESLDTLLDRFFHLMTEMAAYDVKTTPEEQINCIADALSSKWSSVIMVLRQLYPFESLDLNDFIKKLKQEDALMKERDDRSISKQNPSLYHAPAPSTSAHAPLQTAMVSNQSATASSNSSRSSGQASTSSSQTSYKAEGTEKICVETTKEHFSLLSNVLQAYEDLVAGKVGNSSLTEEDYSQIDKDDMELMDIKWCLASGIRRAKEWVKRTGRDISADRNTKFGFDMSKGVCYNCGEKGHFKRQCTQPSKSGKQSPFNQSDSKALVTVTPKMDNIKVEESEDSLDWSIRLSDVNDRGLMARVAEMNEDSASDGSVSED